MGLIDTLLTSFFGGGRNAVAEITQLFVENREKAAERSAAYRAAALAQFGAEFAVPRQSWFDRFMDGLNRLPRPAMALGTIGLFVSAMTQPVWFAARMQGIALVPEPLWWLMGAIVSFYFGARYQVKTQEFQRSLAATLGRAGTVTRNLAALQALDEGAGGDAQQDIQNKALIEWKSR